MKQKYSLFCFNLVRKRVKLSGCIHLHLSTLNPLKPFKANTDNNLQSKLPRASVYARKYCI